MTQAGQWASRLMHDAGDYGPASPQNGRELSFRMGDPGKRTPRFDPPLRRRGRWTAIVGGMLATANQAAH